MLRKKSRLALLNDGVVELYRERGRKTDFGARRNVRSTADMELLATMCYQERSCRDQDFEFAEMRGFSLSRKVRTYALDGVDSGCRAVIAGDLYSIGHIDRDGAEMYLYMTSVGKVQEEEP